MKKTFERCVKLAALRLKSVLKGKLISPQSIFCLSALKGGCSMLV